MIISIKQVTQLTHILKESPIVQYAIVSCAISKK